MAESVRETSSNKNQAGLYRHPETGAEVVVDNHAKFGTTKADGFVRVGYQYVGPAPEKEDKQTQEEPKVEMPTKEEPKPEAKKGSK
jgi:hypothetical protein